MSEWTDNLKRGDEVAVFGGFRGDNFLRIERVEGRTPTGRINTTSQQYTKDGYQVGGGSSPYHLQPVTDELRAAEEVRLMRWRLWQMDGQKWSKVPAAQIRAIVAILDGVQ